MDREAEEKEAREWLAAHPDVGGSLPSDHYRSETGETLSQDPEPREADPHRNAVYSYHGGWGIDAWEELNHTRSAEYAPRSPEQLVIRDRMERAMGLLREDQQTLLRLRYFEDMTNEAIGKELGVTESAVRQKLAVAEQDLYVALTKGQQ